MQVKPTIRRASGCAAAGRRRGVRGRSGVPEESGARKQRGNVTVGVAPDQVLA